MANHKSAVKRNRASKKKERTNRIKKTAVRKILKKIRTNTDKKSASEQLVTAASLIDKLAKTNYIHKNKAANLKSSLTRYVNSLK